MPHSKSEFFISKSIEPLRWTTDISGKKSCSVYRYDAKQNAFFLAAYFRYGSGLKTKFKYKVAKKVIGKDGIRKIVKFEGGDGITGKIVDTTKHYDPPELLIISTRDEQKEKIPNRSTIDSGAFLLISTLRDRKGSLIGCIKIEDTKDGKEDDVSGDKQKKILNFWSVLLESTTGNERSREWWNIDHQYMEV